MQKTINVVISGYYGKTNAGDEAILYSILKQIRNTNKNANITVLSLRPENTKNTYCVNSIYTFDFKSIKKILKQNDVFISGGGTLLQNVTSTKSLLYYLYLILLAKKYKNKVIMYACGVGPIKGKIIRKITSYILNKCVDHILLRDNLSYTELSKLNVNLDKVELGIDPSLLLNEFIKIDKDIFDKFNLDKTKKYVGISINKINKNIIQEMENILIYLNKKNIIPILIPMDYNDDLKVLKDLIKETKIPYYIIDKNISFIEKYSLISNMEFVIGMRLHTILFSYLLGVKVIGISYDSKINAFCDDWGIPNLIDIKEFNYYNFIKEFKSLKLVELDNEKIKRLNKINEKVLNKYLKNRK